MATLGRPGALDAAATVLASLGGDGELVLVWQAEGPPPELPPGARAVHVLPAGLSYARNRGAAAATADLIAFVDDDELAAPGWAAGALAGFEAGADAVFGPVEAADEDGRPYCVLEGDTARWIAPDERPWNAGTGGNMAITRAALERLGGFELRLGAGSAGRSAEDTHLIARLQQAGMRLRWQPEMGVAHPTKTDEEVLASRYPYGFGAGRMARLLRSGPLATKYAIDLAWAASAVRSPRDARETLATARGFAAGALRADVWHAPAAVLDRAPREIREALAGETARGLPVPHRPDPHFLYRAGDRILHVYAEPGDGRREALRARERLAASGLPVGVPRLHVAVETPAALWVLEDRIHGRPAEPAERDAWWPGATALVAELARTTGPPVREGAWWAQAAPRLANGRPEVRAALERIGERASVIVHGDVQPKNLVVEGGRVGLVDWDGALADGPPGIDALFLAVTADGGIDPAPVVRAADRDAAIVAAATWAEVEARSRAPGPFAQLLDAVLTSA